MDAKEAAKHPAMQRADLTTQHFRVPNANNTKAEKFCPKVTLFIYRGSYYSLDFFRGELWHLHL